MTTQWHYSFSHTNLAPSLGDAFAYTFCLDSSSLHFQVILAQPAPQTSNENFPTQGTTIHSYSLLFNTFNHKLSVIYICGLYTMDYFEFPKDNTCV